MKNKSLKKRVLFLLTCLTIIAIGICLPIVGTTLASNDTTKASPTSTSTSPIETGVKVDKNGSLINLSTEFDGPYILDNKNNVNYSQPNAISIKYNNCFDSLKYTTKAVEGTTSLPNGTARSLTYKESDLASFYDPYDSSSKSSVDGVGIFGGVDYSVEIIYDFTKAYRTINPYQEDYVIASDIKMTFLKSNLTNVQAPTNISVYASIDGKTYYAWNGAKVTNTKSYNSFSIVEYTFSRDTFAKAKYFKYIIYQNAMVNTFIDKIHVLTRSNNSIASTQVYKCIWELQNYVYYNIKSVDQFNGLTMSFVKGSISNPETRDVVKTGAKTLTAKCSDDKIKSVTAYSGVTNKWNNDKYVLAAYDSYNNYYNEYIMSFGAQDQFLLERGHYATFNKASTKNDIIVPDFIGRTTFISSSRKVPSDYMLGSPVVEITSKALANKGNINSITIGRNVHKIASDAFTGTNAKYIKIDGTNTSFYVKNNVLYDKNNKVIYKGIASTGGEIVELSKSVNELITKAGYSVDIVNNENLLKNINPCTLISDFAMQFSGKQIKINGVLLDYLKDNYIKTGDKITIDNVQYVAIVWGDGNGDGKVNAADYILARRSILNIVELNTYQTRALCVTGSSKVASADYIKIRKYIIGEVTL